MSEAKITNDILLKMNETDRVKALELLSVLDKRKTQDEARNSFIRFVECMWDDFIPGPHHKRIAEAFEKVRRGELKRLIINLPPRHSKSEFASYLLPAWWLGHNPKDQIMQISHTAELAEGFGRKVRNLVSSDGYADVFPNTKMSKDSTAAARWNTSAGGKYVAMGVGGAVAGLGSNLLIIDDPCLLQDTLLLTPQGLKRIQDITTEDKVAGRDGFCTVNALYTTQHDHTTTINDNLIVSYKHPIWTENRGWVVAKDLVSGDILLTNRLQLPIVNALISFWGTTWQRVKRVKRVIHNALMGRCKKCAGFNWQYENS
jgi:hypothetical protein